LDAKTDVLFGSLRQRVSQSAGTLDAPVLNLTGPVEIDELCVAVVIKGCDATSGERSCDVSNHQLYHYQNVFSLMLNTDNWFEKILRADLCKRAILVFIDCFTGYLDCSSIFAENLIPCHTIMRIFKSVSPTIATYYKWDSTRFLILMITTPTSTRR